MIKKPYYEAYKIYNPDKKYWSEFATGMVGDYMCNVIIAPLNRLKVLRQMELLHKVDKKIEESVPSIDKREKFKLIVAHKEVLKIIERQGVLSLWTGLLAYAFMP